MPRHKPEATPAEAKKWRRQGLSIATIMARFGVSKSTVQNLLAGTYTPPRFPKRDQPAGRHYLDLPVRCPGCGGLVIEVPCLLCAIRRGKASHA